MLRRAHILWLCLLVVGTIMLLASSLHDVRFEPGLSFSSAAAARTPAILPELQRLPATPAWRIVLFWAAVVADLVLFLFLLPTELRKRIMRQLMGLALGLLLLVLAMHFRILQLPILFGENGPGSPPDGPMAGSQLPLPIFEAPSVPSWIAYGVSLLGLWALGLLAWFMSRRWNGLAARQRSPLGRIEAIAQASLSDIADGRRWTDVVLQAYSSMVAAAEAQRGVRRHFAATPREFADRLTGAGLPAEAVAGLTRLFESVRYGDKAASKLDEAQAVSYLTSILRACGAPS